MLTAQPENPIVPVGPLRKCPLLTGNPLAPVTPNLSDARRRWLAELYEANSPAVFNLCRRLLNSRDDAADATHEVFLRAAASLSEPPTSAQARAWLITVARNHCIDLLRRRERLGLALTTLGATSDADAASVEAVEDRQLLLAVLKELGVRDREALWQSAVERRSLAEIARSFGLSYTAAAKLLSRARQRALVLAARLAAILGLAQLGRGVRRVKLVQRSQQLAAVVVVPVLIAALVVSSAPHVEIGAGARSLVAGVQLPGPSIGHRATRLNGQLPPTGPSTPPEGTGALAVAPVAQVPGAKITAVRPVPAPGDVTSDTSPVPSDIDVDHGDAGDHVSGRDRDDRSHKHHGHGKARGHRG